MIFMNKKLEKVYINFLKVYNLALSKNIYIVILICKKIRNI